MNNEELKAVNEEAHKKIVDDAKNYGQMIKSNYRVPYPNQPYVTGMENQAMPGFPKYQTPYYAPPFPQMPHNPSYSGVQNNNFSANKNEAQADLFNNPK